MQKGSPTYRHLRTKLIGKLWKAYKATTALEFLKELRLALICRKKHIRRKRTLQKMRKLCRRAAQFKVAYQFPQAHRTSNMLDCAPRTGFRQSLVEEEIALNLMGMLTITRLIAKRMAKQKEGTIVNVSSLMGKVAAPTMSTYSATKFAIVGFTQALRRELAPHNVRVIALLPTLTDTDMANNLKLFRWVMSMTPEKVASALILGLYQEKDEILVGWQSYLAVWCQRIFPWLLDKILMLTAPII